MSGTTGFTQNVVTCAEAGSLPGLFRVRCERTPDAEAYRQYDAAAKRWESYSWRDVAELTAQWQASLAQEGFEAGARVAILLKNSVEWVCMDQAAQSLGLVVVPLYTTDNPHNIAYILGDCGARLLLLADAADWHALAPIRDSFPDLAKVLCVNTPAEAEAPLTPVKEWLVAPPGGTDLSDIDPHGLATIVYTSGTTGRPKGVMLSHHNILSNVEAVLKLVPGYMEDVYLSFLPLSHAFERTVGYYLPVMAGSTVVFARSVPDLPEDLLTVQPTVLISVPRIYERVYDKLQGQLSRKGGLATALFERAQTVGWSRFLATQGRGKKPGVMARLSWPVLQRLVAHKILARLGGRLRLAISGGAPLAPKLSRCFIGLGLPVLQGYGLTETSPIVTANTLQDNLPESVGVPLPGVEVELGAENELLVRGPNIMLGYWNDPEKTRQTIDEDGWLHTGDIARIDDQGHIFIAGRLKEIIVMSTGEKVPPGDLELALTGDPLFDQAMVTGEGKPHLVAVIVLNSETWPTVAGSIGLEPDAKESLEAPALMELIKGKVAAVLQDFPAYARIPAVHLTLQPWTIENGMITPTMKLKRQVIEEKLSVQISRLYEKHSAVRQGTKA
ncbi:MAG: AMP-binding protein [Ectothiorhodospiraceae bacterium]|nr:AMP-binding protein [Ectothiorhodospiraceae bacterium]